MRIKSSFDADAWNMLYGFAKDCNGSEADIEVLRLEATNAKHKIDTDAKVCSPSMQMCRSTSMTSHRSKCYCKT